MVDLPSAAQRRLLAALALADGATQRTEYLSDALELSTGSLRTTVSRLRSRIGDDVIHTDTAGYRITCAVDATMFTDLLVERPDHPDRLAALDEALALWHGEALDEFRHEPWAAPEVARLDELRGPRGRGPRRAADRPATRRGGGGVARGPRRRQPAARPAPRPAHPGAGQQRPPGRRAARLPGVPDLPRRGDRHRAVRARALDRAARRRRLGRRRRPPTRPSRAPAGRRRRAPVVDVPLPGELAEAPDADRPAAGDDLARVRPRRGPVRFAAHGAASAARRASARRRCSPPSPGPSTAGRQRRRVRPLRRGRRGPARALPQHRRDAGRARAARRCSRSTASGAAASSSASPPASSIASGPRRRSPSDDATERYQLFEAVADLLRRVASAGSLTLILDDLHWAEPTALLLLRHLGRALVDAPVLVVAGYRDTRAGRRRPSSGRRSPTSTEGGAGRSR